VKKKKQQMVNASVALRALLQRQPCLVVTVFVGSLVPCPRCTRATSK
jgi:hypothetical protein